MKERLVVNHIDDHYAIARLQNGSEVYISEHVLRNTPGLYVGRAVFANVLPPPPGRAYPVARDIQFTPSRPAPADYNPKLTDEEQALWKLFLELKTRYAQMRLARPLPALETSVRSWAHEFVEMKDTE